MLVAATGPLLFIQ